MDFNTAIQQMVAIARAVSFEAKLVIMDEPTSSLDEREVAVLFDVIRQLKRERRRGDLRQPQARRALRRLRPGHRSCATAAPSPVGRDGRASTKLAAGRGHARARPRDGPRPRGPPRFTAGPSRPARELLRGRASARSAGACATLSLAVRARRDRRACRPARLRPHRDGPRGLRRRPRRRRRRSRSTASRSRFAQPADAIARGHGLLLRGPQGRGHRARHVGAREPDAGAAAAPGPRRRRRRGAAARDRRALHRAGSASSASGPEQKIRELSGGNQQKVLLARWLCMNPKLLILDEPTRGIDVGAKAEIQRLIRELADQGLGVLMISSEIEEIDRGRRPGLRAARRAHRRRAAARRASASRRVMAAMAHGDGDAECRRWLRPACRPVGPCPAPACPAVALRRARRRSCCSCCSTSPSRRTSPRWQTLNVNLTQVCTIVIVAVGMTLVIATGGIDLSVGSLMAIAGAAGAADLPGPAVPAAAPLRRRRRSPSCVPVLVAGLFGLFNGWLITRFRIQPIVATLVLFIAGRGIAQVLTNGNLQVFKTPEFQFIGLGRVLGIPVPGRSSWRSIVARRPPGRCAAPCSAGRFSPSAATRPRPGSSGVPVARVKRIGLRDQRAVRRASPG